MDTTRYLLEVGLYSMAKASEENRWFPGHIGASLIAIGLFLEENRGQITSELEKAVVLKAEEIIRLNSVHYEAIYSTEPTSLAAIEEAIAVNIDTFSADGHGVIYGALALKAIDLLEANISQDVINKIGKIVRSAQDDNVARYWQIDNYKEAAIEETDLVQFETIEQAALYCLTHQDHLLGNLVIDDKKYFFEGSRLHEVTHSHALLVLKELGYRELAAKGLQGLKKQVYFNSHFPGDLEPAQLDFLFNPLEPAFWQYPIKDYHHYKLAYSVFSMCASLGIKDRDEILKSMSLHWKILNA